MRVDGIPFKISIPSSQEIFAVTIDNILVKYHVETNGGIKMSYYLETWTTQKLCY